jgi:hypothetical protein
MAHGRPQLIQEILRQADIDAGDENVGAQTFKLSNTSAELFFVLMVCHKFSNGPNAGVSPVLSAKETDRHVTPPSKFAEMRHFFRKP